VCQKVSIDHVIIEDFLPYIK